MIVGRLACPWCGFTGAHVKRKPGARAYHYCPDCGMTTAARNGMQERLLTHAMRRTDGEAPRPPAADAPIIVRRAGHFDGLIPGATDGR